LRGVRNGAVWPASLDPCTLLLGSAWRIPNNSEWINVLANVPGHYPNYMYPTELKLHAADVVREYNNGNRTDLGWIAGYWSSYPRTTTEGAALWDDYSNGYYLGNEAIDMATALPVRCLRNL